MKMHLMMIIMAFPLLGIVFFFFFPFSEALMYYLLALAVSAFFYWLMFKVVNKLPVMGQESMMGLTAEVLSWGGDSGKVSCRGEIWKARSQNQEKMSQGMKVNITAVEGIVLIVEPLFSDIRGTV